MRSQIVCWLLGHREFPEARWVMERWPEEGRDKQLWMFYRCDRCRRLRFIGVGKERWSDYVQRWSHLAILDEEAARD